MIKENNLATLITYVELISLYLFLVVATHHMRVTATRCGEGVTKQLSIKSEDPLIKKTLTMFICQTRFLITGKHENSFYLLLPAMGSPGKEHFQITWTSFDRKLFHMHRANRVGNRHAKNIRRLLYSQLLQYALFVCVAFKVNVSHQLYYNEHLRETLDKLSEEPSVKEAQKVETGSIN